MKVIFVNGSSHANGTTMQAVKEMQKIFSSAGVETHTGLHPVRLLRDARCLRVSG